LAQGTRNHLLKDYPLAHPIYDIYFVEMIQSHLDDPSLQSNDKGQLDQAFRAICKQSMVDAPGMPAKAHDVS